MDMIRENVRTLKAQLPAGVFLEAAAKTRSPAEVADAIAAGVDLIGENYVQEGQAVYETVNGRVPLHFIGHLQRNKAKQAVEIFDMIETLDSLRLARELDRHAANMGKVIPVLVEINSGREPQKYGILPEDLESFLQQAALLEHIAVQGLMTMGPFTGDPELARPYFQETKACFERAGQLTLPNVEMRHLSMGMTSSYQVAIEEGATIVRIGTRIFGPRP
ncbi:YggS family pyridoxal phosphate-dependent enzyme [bacterium]|nr:YggS family pyridoxal phosphate-dependent enzyme [bacterium]